MSDVSRTGVTGSDVLDPARAPARVLVVDDRRAVAEGLAGRLRQEPVIGEVDVAVSLAQARAVVAHRPPHVVLLDPDLGGQPGLELIPHLDTLPVRPCVLVVADVDEPAVVVEALVLGAHSWVPRDVTFEDLLSAVTAARQGELHRPGVAWGPVVMELMAQRDARDAREEFVGQLTTRQREILRCLVAGMTRAQVAAHLDVSPHTVRTHVRDMFRVMGVHSTPHLVTQARSAGVEGIPLQRSPRT
jgi:two-component system nitrate/nitrite response regulator NarL